MNLTDQEILELSELCSALADDRLTESQRARLTEWLKQSEAARQFYVRHSALSAGLMDYAGEMQSETADAASSQSPAFAWLVFVKRFRWALGTFAAAAAVALTLWLNPFSTTTPEAAANTENEPDIFVARVTGAKNCQWISSSSPIQAGDHLRRGQRLDLQSGVAEIIFDSGAQVLLEGPAGLDLNSAWDAVLRRGTLKASVPPEAIGFRISNPAVEVVDLGTEFSMVADESGATEVFVLKGAVEAASNPSADRERESLVLHEKQSRRFARSGVSDVRNSEQKFKRLSRKIALDRPVRPIGYAHWSFDGPGSATVAAEVLGMPPGSYDAHLETASAQSLSNSRTEGRWEQALQLDGQSFAKAPFRGISKPTSRTIAFWVKIPLDAQLREAAAMVAWPLDGAGYGGRSIQVAWNRNPTQGVLGALRTETEFGFLVGTTPLRDGRWHHIAVVLVPGHKPNVPLQMKQYVDGRLEGASAKNAKRRRMMTPARGDGVISNGGDFVWIGHGTGNPRRNQQRFRGALDELVIADRALTPFEIRHLLKENKLLSPALLAEDFAAPEFAEKQ